MKKFPKTKATGNLGVAYVNKVISEAGSIFREIPEGTDVGLDGYIELVKDEIATGLLVAVQIKSGSSYLVQFSDGLYFKVKASKADIHYWNKQPIPVALIAYDPKTELSGWLDITEYIQKHPEALEHDKTVITIHGRARPFNSTTFQTQFGSIFSHYRPEPDIFGFAESIVSSEVEDKLYGIFGLMNHERSRSSQLTGFLLVNHLFHDNDTIRVSATHALAQHINRVKPSHKQWHNTQNFALNALGNFAMHEVEQLLDTAWLDEENFPATISQSVMELVKRIPGYENHLYQIARNPNASHENRWAALVLIRIFGIEATAEMIIRKFNQIDWQDVYEAAHWILEMYDISE